MLLVLQGGSPVLVHLSVPCVRQAIGQIKNNQRVKIVVEELIAREMVFVVFVIQEIGGRHDQITKLIVTNVKHSTRVLKVTKSRVKKGHISH